MKNMDWFDEHGWMQRPIPEDAWRECSAPGQNDEAVEYWLHELQFYIPTSLHQKARDYLAEFGAWDDAELDAWLSTEDTEHEIAKHVLWLFCGDIREGQGDCLYLGH